jgi:hypothetical protein
MFVVALNVPLPLKVALSGNRAFVRLADPDLDKRMEPYA